jgi:secondary thiamine-phosphate synthase enzyme
MLTKIKIQTPPKESLINITEQVKEAVRASGVQEGLCVLVIPHTTAAITLNSALDAATATDIISDVQRLIPTRVDFNHIYDTPADAAGHIKSTLIGASVTLIVTKGELLLGGSQFILFYEFDGPRQREINVRIMEDR